MSLWNTFCSNANATKNDILVGSLPPIIMTTQWKNVNRPYIFVKETSLFWRYEIPHFSAENCWSCWMTKPKYITKLSYHLIFFVQLAIRKLIFFKHLENFTARLQSQCLKRSAPWRRDDEKELVKLCWSSWTTDYLRSLITEVHETLTISMLNVLCIHLCCFACFSWILPHRLHCDGFAAQEPWPSTTTTWAQLYGLRLTGPPNHASMMQPSEV